MNVTALLTFSNSNVGWLIAVCMADVVSRGKYQLLQCSVFFTGQCPQRDTGLKGMLSLTGLKATAPCFVATEE